jgi:hypothetical protein
MRPFSFPRPSRSSLAKFLFGIVLGLGAISVGHAADGATAQITATPLGGGEFDYTITLTDTGTTNLETFWYSWIPGEDFMPVAPTNIVSPTDWTANITHGAPSDGYAIQWLTSSSSTPNPLTPNSSLVFSYESTDTPAVTAGNSSLFPGEPVGRSFVYSGGPFSDSGFQFDVASVPEPSMVGLLVGSLLALFLLGRRRIKATFGK